MIVIKRDGNKERFDRQKIVFAIKMAGVENPEVLASMIQDVLPKESTIDEVHATVVDVLTWNNEEVAANRYQSYKEGRDLERDKSNNLFDSILGIIDGEDSETLRANANKPAEQFPTMRDIIAGQAVKHYAIKKVFPKHLSSAHNDGTLHIHDLDHVGLPLANCCLVDAETMLREGFSAGGSTMESPNSIRVAANMLSTIIGQVASHQFGK